MKTTQNWLEHRMIGSQRGWAITGLCDALPDPTIPHWLRDLADPHGYEIQELTGHGGQGSADLAYDRRYREMVAIKTMRYIDAASLMGFHREFLRRRISVTTTWYVFTR